MHGAALRSLGLLGLLGYVRLRARRSSSRCAAHRGGLRATLLLAGALTSARGHAQEELPPLPPPPLLDQAPPGAPQPPPDKAPPAAPQPPAALQPPAAPQPPPAPPSPPPDPPFRPAWAPTAALLLTWGVHTHLSYGAELGLRRWLNPYLLVTGVLNYERARWDTWPRQPEGSDSLRSHNLSLVARLELAGWDSDVRKRLNIPDASVYPLVGLVTALGASGGVGTGVGYRVGGGFTLFRYTGSFAIPMTFQSYYQAVYFPGAKAHGGVLSLGLAL